ncbi:MAG: S8 family peptidase [Candidatus Falkowbacteria bacterium]
MKKLLIFSLILGMMLAAGGIVAAAGMEKAGDENSRYLVKSNSDVLKMMYGVKHNFDRGFTTDLSPGQLKVLDKFGVDVEKVQIYSINAKPYCGDEKCHPSESADSCPEDCSTTPPPESYCGDGTCDINETTASCPEDCPAEPEPTRDCLPSNTMPWGINKVGGSKGGTGILVAVLDTGVDRDHPDLVENIDSCLAFGYRSCDDDNGHGSHVAGTILANGGSDGLGIVGVAPEAKLMAIKVLNRKGSGYTDDIAKGIEYAADNDAKIISMSLGGSIESSLMKDAITYAVSKGVLVIASAGNSGPSEDSIGYPAANINVVAVAAFDSSDNIADFSSRGSDLNVGDWIIQEREIEFAAPGVYVESAWKTGCYNTISGTSMAAPHITGLAARDWKNSASETRTYLQGLAKIGYDYGQPGDDIEAGFGLPIAE